MIEAQNPLFTHLETGVTTVCHCWSLIRQDGTAYGFTDHDLPLSFDGIEFIAQSGMSAKALQQNSGLSVDNSEAVGALSSSVISETDIIAGRYDAAKITIWLVNWADVSQRKTVFSGSIGELQRKGGAFQAELRGLSQDLNHPQGRIYHKDCAANFGDHDCGVDLDVFGYATEIALEQIEDTQKFSFENLTGFDDGWFANGRVHVLSGAGQGLVGVIKTDVVNGTTREIELWESIRADLQAGDMVRFETGCDKRVSTCRLKFDNLLNFRGFPHIPGEDWLTSYPANSTQNDGGSLTSG